MNDPMTNEMNTNTQNSAHAGKWVDLDAFNRFKNDISQMPDERFESPEPGYEELPLELASSVSKVIPEQLCDPQFRFVTLHPKGDSPEWNGKVPSMKWKDRQLQINSPKLKKQIENVGTYAVATGHGGLVVIDVDHEDARELVDKLPETFTVLSGNKKLPHIYFRVLADDIESFSLKRPLTSEKVEEWAQEVVDHGIGVLDSLSLDSLLDVQAAGKIVVGPGSKFDEDTVYSIAKDVPIYTVTIENRDVLDVIQTMGCSLREQKDQIIAKAQKLSPEFKQSCDPAQAIMSGQEKPWKSSIWKEIEEAVKVSHVYAHFGVEMEPSKTKRFECLLGHSSSSKANVHCENDRIWHCHNCKERGSAWELFHKVMKNRYKSNWFQNSKKFAALAGEELRVKWLRYLQERSANLGDRANMSSAMRKLYTLNDSYFLAFHNGKMRVMEESTDVKGNSVITSMSDRDFKLRYGNREIYPAWRQNPTTLGAEWLRWKHRRSYESVVFYPGDLDETKSTRFYNLWKGFEVKGVPGEFPKLKYHLKHIWCRGNEEHYKYLITWFAHLIQYPHLKPGVALVIKGGKGTGKSTIFEGIFERLLGSMYSKIDKGSQVTGKFNAHQRAKLLLVLEEAIWAGDKQAEGALKSMITEKRTMYEPKGVDAFEEDSYVRLAFVSNEKRAVPASADERRFFCLHVSDEKKTNHDYFGDLWDEINDGGLEAFMHYLETFKFNPKDVMSPPQTSALFEDMYEGFSIFEKWAYDLLHLGNEDAEELVADVSWNSKVTTSDLFEHYQKWIEQTEKVRGYLGYNDVTSQNMLTRMLNKQFGFASTKLGSRSAFILPKREEARKTFASKMNAQVTWNDCEFPSGDDPLEEIVMNQ